MQKRFYLFYVAELNDNLTNHLKNCQPNTVSASFFFVSSFSLTVSHSVDPRNNTETLLDFNSTPFLCTLQIVPFAKGVSPRALFSANNQYTLDWPCGRNSVWETQQDTFQLHIPRSNQDWTNPLKFNFTVTMRDGHIGNKAATDILPIINRRHGSHVFSVQFDKQCGDDNGSLPI